MVEVATRLLQLAVAAEADGKPARIFELPPDSEARLEVVGALLIA